MIQVAGSIIQSQVILSQYPTNSLEGVIIGILASSSEVYRYRSMEELNFELMLRKSIVKASRDLNNSYFAFEVFRESRCNPDYWNRTPEGGFLLKQGIKPSAAIRDIYVNSRLYGTECATAIVILYYKALVDVMPEELFNRLFAGIYLMNWQHLDRDLGIATHRNQRDYLPGDCRYFRNPDVDPETPQWQGENAIDLGDGTYYGHGIGIRTAEGIIDALNRRRFSGSMTSAYLMDTATRPDFKYLAHQYNSFSRGGFLGHLTPQNFYQ